MARIDLGKVVGDSATIEVGSVTTLEAGQNATVVNTGTELNGVFDFGIPKGPKGDKGDTGSQGPVGPQGVQGKAFTIDKTYSSVLDMEADFNNMEVGSYVMIASNVESEDNARLYYRDTNEWKFISDFSGATGIQGEQGPQGQAGYTPVKGVDYFTSADIAEIEDDIKEITGDLANLDTTDKTNLVSAINEVASSSGGSGSLFIDSEENGHDNTIEFINRYLNYGFTDCWVNWGTVLRRIRGVNPTVYSNYVALNIGVDNGIPETPNQTTYYGITYYTAYRFENKIIYVSREEYENKNITEIYENTNLSDVATKGLYTTTRSILKMAVIDETRCPLAIKNTSSYTPTGDYNPATKKYVDDSITAAITTTLGGGY